MSKFTEEEILSIFNTALMQSVIERLNGDFKELPKELRERAALAYSDAAKTVGLNRRMSIFQSVVLLFRRATTSTLLIRVLSLQTNL